MNQPFMLISNETTCGPKKTLEQRAIVPQTRAKTTTILGAISALGIINIKAG
jgi:hypothetical protein